MQIYSISVAVLAVAVGVQAQDKPFESGINEFGAWAGYSLANPTLIGTTSNRRFINAGLRYGFVFGTKGDVAFEYTLDVVPAAILIQPPGTQVAAETGDPRFAGHGRRAVYGGGISPIGFKFIWRKSRKWQPFFGSTAGFVYSAEPVPIPVEGATQFNFTFDFSLGMQILRAGHQAFIVGYKYDHISNAARSSVNPGFDTGVLFAGFSMFR
ncbi:MAG TPA: acyloxyacyl hydrolase [Bryobacteraceae bacterium]|nr:acyloxyacyl hydrolase [Bryobacteraceae bacterium]